MTSTLHERPWKVLMLARCLRGEKNPKLTYKSKLIKRNEFTNQKKNPKKLNSWIWTQTSSVRLNSSLKIKLTPYPTMGITALDVFSTDTPYLRDRLAPFEKPVNGVLNAVIGDSI